MDNESDQQPIERTLESLKQLMRESLASVSNGEYIEALSTLFEAKAIYNELEIEDTLAYAMVLSSIGIVYSQQEKLFSALEYFLEAKNILDDLERTHTAGYAMVMGNIAGIYRRTLRANDALRCYQNARAVYEELGMNEESERIQGYIESIR